jgi:membrane protease YdiL (CAAX protease family)
LAENSETALFFIVAIPFAFEPLFRSLIHGLLLGAHHFQGYGERWSISFPLVATALLYSVCIAVVLLYPAFLQNGLHAQATAACLAAAFGLGLVSGWVREKSQSIFPGILFHALGVAALISYYSGGWVSKIGTFIR